MRLSSDSLSDGDPIPERFAFAKPHPESRVTFAGNVSPHLSWSDFPEETRSFAIICHDYDVPSRGDDVNQPDREVPEDLPRVDFFHWVLVDIPADRTSIDEGEHSEGVVPGGKGVESHVGRHGLNDFTGWFAGDGPPGTVPHQSLPGWSGPPASSDQMSFRLSPLTPVSSLALG